MMKSFELASISPIVLGRIESFARGAKLPFESGELESTIIETVPGRRKWVALTAYGVNGNPIGICDFMCVSDTQSAILESPIIRKRPDLSVPAFDLRATANDDGIYVVEAYRGKHIGSILLKTAIEIAHRTGSRRFFVRHGEIQSGWYKKLGGREVLGGFLFNL